MAMTPLEINTAARQRYNAVGDDFWPDAEIYAIIYQGCCELANEGLILEQTYTTTSVADQQEYSLPTNAINVKRITYNGRKLSYITFREDDVLTILNQTVGASGIPNSYALWNDVIYLRPIPAEDAVEIKIWANIEPQSVTSSSTLEVPAGFHMALVNYVLAEMSAKNKNYSGAQYYRELWEKDLQRAKRLNRKKRFGDSFQVVKNVDTLHQNGLGDV